MTTNTEKMNGRDPTGQALVASDEARSGLHPSGFDPSRKAWHLVCITRLGKVSMLRDLDLVTARETYKRLRGEDHPKQYVFSDCKCGKYGWSWIGDGGSYGPHDDWLEKVEVIGPQGKSLEDLDPWHGVAPHIIDMTHLCRCGHRKGPEPKWDASRTDFWNNPKLWEGIDPTKQMCWRRRPDEYLHSDGAGGSGSKHHQRRASDLRRDKRSQGVSPQRRNHAASNRAKNRPLERPKAPPQSERTGA
jgi:hypothetical protein